MYQNFEQKQTPIFNVKTKNIFNLIKKCALGKNKTIKQNLKRSYLKYFYVCQEKMLTKKLV